MATLKSKLLKWMISISAETKTGAHASVFYLHHHGHIIHANQHGEFRLIKKDKEESEDGSLIWFMELNNLNYEEFKGQIIDILEDFCDEQGIFPKSKARDMYVNELMTDEGASGTYKQICEDYGIARIYGEEYDDILAGVDDALSVSVAEDPFTGITRDAAEEIAKATLENFSCTIDESKDENGQPAEAVFSLHQDELKDRIMDTFSNWGLITDDPEQVAGENPGNDDIEL